MKSNQKQVVAWCDPKPDKTNPMQCKAKAISPDGNVVEISLATGKTITSMLGNNYGQLIEMQKKARGWVWYDSFDDDEARDALIAARRAVKATKNADYSKMFETKMDKIADALEKATLGQIRPTLSDEQLQAALVEPAPAPKKPKKADK